MESCPLEGFGTSSVEYSVFLSLLLQWGQVLNSITSKMGCYIKKNTDKSTDLCISKLCFVLRRFRVRLPFQRPTILTDIFCDFPLTPGK